MFCLPFNKEEPNERPFTSSIAIEDTMLHNGQTGCFSKGRNSSRPARRYSPTVDSAYVISALMINPKTSSHFTSSFFSFFSFPFNQHHGVPQWNPLGRSDWWDRTTAVIIGTVSASGRAHRTSHQTDATYEEHYHGQTRRCFMSIAMTITVVPKLPLACKKLRHG